MILSTAIEVVIVTNMIITDNSDSDDIRNKNFTFKIIYKTLILDWR